MNWFLTVFFAAVLARLGWELGTLLIIQVNHQVDRFWASVHNRQASRRALERELGFHELDRMVVERAQQLDDIARRRGQTHIPIDKPYGLPDKPDRRKW